MSTRSVAMKSRERTAFAAILLYAVSLLGFLSLLVPSSHPRFAPIFSADLFAYTVLLIVAFFIHAGSKIAMVTYLSLSILWFGTLVFFLPERFGHPLDLYGIFMQLVLLVLAYCLLFSRVPRGL